MFFKKSPKNRSAPRETVAEIELFVQQIGAMDDSTMGVLLIRSLITAELLESLASQDDLLARSVTRALREGVATDDAINLGAQYMQLFHGNKAVFDGYDTGFVPWFYALFALRYPELRDTIGRQWRHIRRGEAQMDSIREDPNVETILVSDTSTIDLQRYFNWMI